MIIFYQYLILIFLAASALAAAKNDLPFVNTTQTDYVQTGALPVPVASTLRFLLLGDWGKGGSTGTYGSVLKEDGNAIEKLDVSGNSVVNVVKEVHTETLEGATLVIGVKAAKALYQVAVASAMGAFVQASEVVPSFLIALGDNVYDNGVPSSDSVLWDYLWKDIYLSYQGLNIPWYPIFGNHDYTGGSDAVQAQLQRTVEHIDDDIWQMEATNFTKRFEFQSGNEIVSVGIIFVDTTTLAPNVCNKCNQYASSEVKQALIVNQLAHIESMLASYAADPPTWLLVAGHYPIYSNGAHGDTSELVTYLQPLLEQYHVHAYIAGHDHFSSHLQYKDIEYFIAGAGSMLDGAKYSSAANLLWYDTSNPGFAYVDASADELLIGFITSNQQEMYSYALKNPGPTKHVTIADPPAGGNSGDTNSGESEESEGDRKKNAFEANRTMFVTMGSISVIGLGLFVYVFYQQTSKHTKKRKESYVKYKSLFQNPPTAGVSATLSSSDYPFGLELDPNAKFTKPTVSTTLFSTQSTHESVEEEYDDFEHDLEDGHTEDDRTSSGEFDALKEDSSHTQAAHRSASSQFHQLFMNLTNRNSTAISGSKKYAQVQGEVEQQEEETIDCEGEGGGEEEGDVEHGIIPSKGTSSPPTKMSPSSSTWATYWFSKSKSTTPSTAIVSPTRNEVVDVALPPTNSSDTFYTHFQQLVEDDDISLMDYHPVVSSASVPLMLPLSSSASPSSSASASGSGSHKGSSKQVVGSNSVSSRSAGNVLNNNASAMSLSLTMPSSTTNTIYTPITIGSDQAHLPMLDYLPVEDDNVSVASAPVFYGGGRQHSVSNPEPTATAATTASSLFIASFANDDNNTPLVRGHHRRQFTTSSV